MGALDISYSLLPFMFPTKRKKSLKQMDLPSWYEELLGCTIKGHYCYLPFLPSKSLFQIVLWFYMNFISLLIILWEERLQLSKVSRADGAQPAPKKTTDGRVLFEKYQSWGTQGCENEGKIQSVSPQVLPESQASVVSLILVVHRNWHSYSSTFHLYEKFVL